MDQSSQDSSSNHPSHTNNSDRRGYTSRNRPTRNGPVRRSIYQRPHRNNNVRIQINGTTNIRTLFMIGAEPFFLRPQSLGSRYHPSQRSNVIPTPFPDVGAECPQPTQNAGHTVVQTLAPGPDPFLPSYVGSWQFSLLGLQFDKVECVKFEASFMYERASLLLSSIGLLGEYCPTSRKKSRHSSHIVGCMHLGLSGAYNIHCSGCQFMRPLSGKGGFLKDRDITAAYLTPSQSFAWNNGIARHTMTIENHDSTTCGTYDGGDQMKLLLDLNLWNQRLQGNGGQVSYRSRLVLALCAVGGTESTIPSSPPQIVESRKGIQLNFRSRIV
ncbi:hypothetical protein QYF36_003635 [Acer negundo]|nr:hypothetical protein QYF36_003635 [Acer negundo]